MKYRLPDASRFSSTDDDISELWYMWHRIHTVSCNDQYIDVTFGRTLRETVFHRPVETELLVFIV